MYRELYDKDIAVSLMSFNRPNYLERALESLEQCVDKDKVDWILFQDGAVNKFSGVRRATDGAIDANVHHLMDADLPNKDVRINDENLCSAIQFDRQWKLLEEDYDIVIRTEEDMVVSRYFIRLMVSLIEQFPDTVPTIYREGKIDNKDMNKIDAVERKQMNTTFTTSAMTAETYEKIQPYWEPFRDIIYNTDWWVGNRPREKIWDLYGDDVAVAYDGAMAGTLRKAGVERVQPFISRASHIGEHGMNLNPSNYDDRFGDEGKLEYGLDRSPVKWRVSN